MSSEDPFLVELKGRLANNHRLTPIFAIGGMALALALMVFFPGGYNAHFVLAVTIGIVALGYWESRKLGIQISLREFDARHPRNN